MHIREESISIYVVLCCPLLVGGNVRFGGLALADESLLLSEAAAKFPHQDCERGRSILAITFLHFIGMAEN